MPRPETRSIKPGRRARSSSRPPSESHEDFNEEEKSESHTQSEVNSPSNCFTSSNTKPAASISINSIQKKDPSVVNDSPVSTPTKVFDSWLNGKDIQNTIIHGWLDLDWQHQLKI